MKTTKITFTFYELYTNIQNHRYEGNYETIKIPSGFMIYS
jgi:hypothetical protein